MNLKNNDLHIKYHPKQNAFLLTISYEQFTDQIKGLHNSNIFFSTYRQEATVDGFIPLKDSLYVRLSIIHKLGSIVRIEEDISNKNLVKMKVDAQKKKIIIAIFQTAFQDLSIGYYESKFNIRYPLLNDFYIDLSIASGKKIILERWDIHSSPNRNALEKDFIKSDCNRFNWSQNTDGNRKRNELFTGSGSNLGGAFNRTKNVQKKNTRNQSK